MDLEEFEKIVQITIEDLPEEFKSEIENVGVSVEMWPSEDDLKSVYTCHGTTLLGLYRGIPKTKRGDNYNAVLPDKIIIFAGPILAFNESIENTKKQIRTTVLHELGHYFGMTEDEIRQAQKS